MRERGGEGKGIQAGRGKREAGRRERGGVEVDE